MRTIFTIIFIGWLGIFPSGALANGTDDCIKISDGKILAHDLNTPYLDNCYVFDNSNNSGFSVTVGLIDGQEGDLSVVRYAPSTGEKIVLDNQYSGNGAAKFYHNENIGNEQYVVRLNNLTLPNQAKNIAISKVIVDDIIYVTIAVRKVAEEANNPPPIGGGGDQGHCDPVTGICYDPQGGSQLEIFSIMNNTAGNECTGDLAPPSGFSENYDILQEAEYMRIFVEEIDSQPFVPNVVKDMQKALYFALTMAPHSFYDLKTNENWLSSAEAGNYNYGYLGAAIGLEKETLIQMSGLVQLAFDKINQGEDYPLMKNLGKAIRDRDFSQFDNVPEDPDDIEAGYEAYASGCTPNTNSSNNLNGSGTGGGGSSGWHPSLRSFIGPSRCIGNCSVPIGRVIITDLEPE